MVVDPDTDEEDLTYTIQYSLDGVTWATITTEATTTSGFGTYIWDVSAFDLNTSVNIRIRANDKDLYSEWIEFPFDIVARDTSTLEECFEIDHDPYIRDAHVKQLPPDVDGNSDVEVFFRLQDEDGDLQLTTLTFYLNVPRNPPGDDVDVRDGIYFPLDLGDPAVVVISDPTLIDGEGDIGPNIDLGWHTLKWRAQSDITPANQLNTGAVACITTDDGTGNQDITYIPFILDTRCPGNQPPFLDITFAGQNINRDNIYGYQECGPDVLIYYTIIDPDEDEQTITLEYSIDDGVNYYTATLVYCSGDIGENVIPMTATRIVWDVQKEFALWDKDDRYQDDVWVKLTTNDGHGHIISDSYGPITVDARGVEIANVRVFDTFTGEEVTILTERITIEAIISSFTPIDWVSFEFDINGLDFHRHVTDPQLNELVNNIAPGTYTLSHTFILEDYDEAFFFIGTYLYYRVSAHNVYCNPKSYISHVEVTGVGLYYGEFAVALDLVEGSNGVELVVETATGGYIKVQETLDYDIQPPLFINAFSPALNQFELVFSEPILEDGCDIGNFSVAPSGNLLDWEGNVPIPTVEHVQVSPSAKNGIYLTVIPTVVQGQEYTIDFHLIRDEATNILLANEVDIADFVSNFVFDEDAIGIKNGINTTFQTSANFKEDSLQVYLNGIRSVTTLDYVEIDSQTFQLFVAPSDLDNLRVAYQKESSALVLEFNIVPIPDPLNPQYHFVLPTNVYSTYIRVYINGYRIQSDMYTIVGNDLTLLTPINPLVDFIIADYITSSTIAAYWRVSEIPKGAVNGSNRDFAVSQEIRRRTLEVYYNGLKLREGITGIGDFVLASNQSFLTDINFVPNANDEFVVDYVINEE